MESEKPDAILPTMGGQTALNISVEWAESGVLDKHNIEVIGADLNEIKKAEDRNLFKIARNKIGVNVCPSGIASDLQEAEIVGNKISSFPKIIRPAFTLGGSGGGIAYNQDEFLVLPCKHPNLLHIFFCLLKPEP